MLPFFLLARKFTLITLSTGSFLEGILAQRCNLGPKSLILCKNNNYQLEVENNYVVCQLQWITYWFKDDLLWIMISVSVWKC